MITTLLALSHSAGMTAFFHAIPGGQALMISGLLSTAATAIAWWRDCIIESDMGMHTEVGWGRTRAHTLEDAERLSITIFLPCPPTGRQAKPDERHLDLHRL